MIPVIRNTHKDGNAVYSITLTIATEPYTATAYTPLAVGILLNKFRHTFVEYHGAHDPKLIVQLTAYGIRVKGI